MSGPARSSSGSSAGTTTTSPSSEPRPPTRSSRQSDDTANASPDRDTSHDRHARLPRRRGREPLPGGQATSFSRAIPRQARRAGRARLQLAGDLGSRQPVLDGESRRQFAAHSAWPRPATGTALGAGLLRNDAEPGRANLAHATSRTGCRLRWLPYAHGRGGTPADNPALGIYGWAYGDLRVRDSSRSWHSRVRSPLRHHVLPGQVVLSDG